MRPTEISRRLGGRLVVLALTAAPLASCNAVFGLEDRSFGAGGGGGDGGGGATSTSTGSTATDAGTGGGASGACDGDRASEGDFNPGWESFWSIDDAIAVIEQEDPGPVLHVTIDALDGEGSLTNTPLEEGLCADPCVRVAFSMFPIAGFHLDVIVEDDGTVGGVEGTVRARVINLGVTADAAWQGVQSGEPCRLPPPFASIDRVLFAASETGDFLLDDVVVEVTTCPDAAETCELL